MKRRTRWGRRKAKSCPSGKIRYPNQHAATQALTSARVAGGERRQEARSYECGRCNGGWHLTSATLDHGQPT